MKTVDTWQVLGTNFTFKVVAKTSFYSIFLNRISKSAASKQYDKKKNVNRHKLVFDKITQVSNRNSDTNSTSLALL